MKTQKKSVKSKEAICKSIASEQDSNKKKSRKIKVAIASIAASTALLLGGGFALSTGLLSNKYNNSSVGNAIVMPNVNISVYTNTIKKYFLATQSYTPSISNITHKLDNKNIDEFYVDISHDIDNVFLDNCKKLAITEDGFINKEITEIKELSDFNGFTYFVVEFANSGYMICDSNVSFVIESNLEADSPYKNLSGNLIYMGPTNYYVMPEKQLRNGNIVFEHAVLNEKINLDDNGLDNYRDSSLKLSNIVDGYDAVSLDNRLRSGETYAELQHRDYIRDIGKKDDDAENNTGIVVIWQQQCYLVILQHIKGIQNYWVERVK